MTLWYLIRAAGLAALVLLSLATALGALGSARFGRPDRRVIMQYLHRAAALLGLSLLAVHITAMLLDAKSGITVRAVVIPLASQYRPVAVALGTTAAYLFVVVALFGLLRGRMAGSERGTASWRAIHVVSYAAWALGVAHGFLAGEDSGHTWVRGIDVAVIAGVLLALATRLTRTRQRHGHRLVAAALR